MTRSSSAALAGACGAREAALLALAVEAVAAALQRAVDGRHAVVEQLGHLARRPVEDVAQHDRHTLLGRQQLHRGHEREPDPLSLLHDLLRPGGRRGHVGQEQVRVGLEVRVDGGGRVTASLLQHAQADVGRDPVQPRAERRSWLEAVDTSPGAEHRLLERVVGVVQRAEDPVAVPVQLLPMRRSQPHERLLVAGLGGDEHGVV